MNERIYGRGTVSAYHRDNNEDCCYDDVNISYEPIEVEQCAPIVECENNEFEVVVPISSGQCQTGTPIVIPHVVAATLSEARAFPNHYVFVEETQNWVHIDSYGGTAILSNPFIFLNNFDPLCKEGIFKNMVVYDFAKGKQYIFNPAGQYAVSTIVPAYNKLLGE